MAFHKFLISTTMKTSLSLSSLSLLVVILSVLLVIFAIISLASWKSKALIEFVHTIKCFYKFFYASFLKPHTGDGTVSGQQAALESFYKTQVCPGLI